MMLEMPRQMTLISKSCLKCNLRDRDMTTIASKLGHFYPICPKTLADIEKRGFQEHEQT
jgi:hypothetical protein